MFKRVKQIFTRDQAQVHWRHLWVVLITILVALGIAFVGMVAYANSYNGRVLPGVSLGDAPIGGMTEEDLTRFLQDMTDKLIAEGIHFDVTTVVEGQTGQEEFVLYPVMATDGNTTELVSIDVDKEVQTLMNKGKKGSMLVRALTAFDHRVRYPRVTLSHVEVYEERIHEAVKDYLKPYESLPQDAHLIIDQLDPFSYRTVSSSAGVVYEYDHVVPEIKSRWSVLEVPHIALVADPRDPDHDVTDFGSTVDRLPALFAAGDLTINYTEPQTQRQRRWVLDASHFRDWLEFVPSTEERAAGFGLSRASTTLFLEEQVAPIVNVEAQDALFEISPTGKVIEFQTSRPGVELDVEATADAILDAFFQRNFHDEGTVQTVTVETEQTEPDVATADANDLGITEILGIGHSKFTGSPNNRILNIKNGIRKLNGLLIKPGEEFSAIQHLQPFTTEAGYLPELVIEGDEIKPAMGGGLCQIGSTLFRMAMNSGMEITERRNHSLVVAYYNDLSNGLPGTDATLYDPHPDFRFLNDTGNHVLIQAWMDQSTADLYFALWGTNDGRAGSYQPPVVHRWIPYGETRIIETTKLAPGVRECQHAYTGANASFVYTRTKPDGEVVERVFESHYRPLPEICLVGVAPKTAEEIEQEEQAEREAEIIEGLEAFVNPVTGE